MLDQYFVFQPEPWTEQPWARISGLPLEDVWITVDRGVRIFGWFLDAGPRRPVLLWCHGNAGNVSHRLPNLADLYRHGLSVFLFDYRGYGKSTGEPTEAGLHQDALAAYGYLVDHRNIDPRRLVLFGRSLGTSVAGAVARQRPAAGLVLEGAFPSIQAMADHHYFGFPAHWFIDATLNLQASLAEISLPLLVIHGQDDHIVPLKFGKQVFEAAREPKRWYVVPRAGHNDVPFVGGRTYYQHVMAFIRHVTI